MACTPADATSCPHCGRCTCTRLDDGSPRPARGQLDRLHDFACPLHGDSNTHCKPDPRNLSLFDEVDDAE